MDHTLFGGVITYINIDLHIVYERLCLLVRHKVLCDGRVLMLALSIRRLMVIVLYNKP